MSYVSSDPNYTDPNRSGNASATERVGDISGEAPTNEATERKVASKLNLLEGLTFSVNKEEIKNHLNRKSPSMSECKGHQMTTEDRFKAKSDDQDLHMASKGALETINRQQ
jgi:hypothetical protein